MNTYMNTYKNTYTNIYMNIYMDIMAKICVTKKTINCHLVCQINRFNFLQYVRNGYHLFT